MHRAALSGSVSQVTKRELITIGCGVRRPYVDQLAFAAGPGDPSRLLLARVDTSRLLLARLINSRLVRGFGGNRSPNAS
jgi:hypothetical protein